MLTVLDVIDDALKIGLGGFIAWLISKGSRSHEFEKERRRRKQDCLERVIEDLDEQQSALSEWCVMNLTHRQVKEQQEKDPALEKHTLNIVNQLNKTSEAARTKLIRSQSKLIVFGFDECATALRAFNNKVLNFRVDVIAVRDGKKDVQVYKSGHSEIAKSAESVREAVKKAFATL